MLSLLYKPLLRGPLKTLSPYRTFSLLESALPACWKCGDAQTEVDGITLFCRSCEAIQPIETETSDLFALFSMDQTFKLNISRLEASFKELQKQLHPDKFAAKSLAEREASATASSTVNQAYQILCDPVERARYLLQRHGFNVLDEGGDRLNDPALMGEMFLLRESVEEASTLGELLDVEQGVQFNVDAACDALQSCLDANDVEGLPAAAVRLKYYSKVMEEISERRGELGGDD